MTHQAIYHDDHGRPITRAAWAALAAARMRPRVGRWAALRWGLKNGASLRLQTIARQLLAMQAAEELIAAASESSKL